MGYIVNILPLEIAKNGHEVIIITPNVQIYFNSKDYHKNYYNFLGEPITKVEEKDYHGVKLVKLKHRLFRNEAIFNFFELFGQIRKHRPDIIQTFQVDSFIQWQVIFCKLFLKFNLFSANHILFSVFEIGKQWNNLSFLNKVNWKVKHYLGGRFISFFVNKYFMQTKDAVDVAVSYFGVPIKKCVFDPLGVDTNLFSPSKSNRDYERIEKGFEKEDFICIYTGRFSKSKNPLILAKAIEQARKQNKNIKGVFIGNGPQKDLIIETEGCKVFSFVKHQKLPRFYQLADIGVWPREESTSMLDALACGLPLIISDKASATERIEGSGVSYVENDFKDLAQKILDFSRMEESKFHQMSKIAEQKIIKNFSWSSVAQKRIKFYYSSL